MSVITNSFRYFTSKWFIDNAANNNIYCGVSPQNLSIDESYKDITNSLSLCSCFCKCNSSFLSEANKYDYDLKTLIKQNYYSHQNIVSYHNITSDCYWRQETIEEALNKCLYNISIKFNIKNTDDNYFDFLRNVKTFIFYLNFTINGEKPSQDFNIFDNNNIYNASSIIAIENIVSAIGDDNGRILDLNEGIIIPDNYVAKIVYLCSN